MGSSAVSLSFGHAESTNKKMGRLVRNSPSTRNALKTISHAIESRQIDRSEYKLRQIEYRAWHSLYEMEVFINGEYDIPRDRDLDRKFERHLKLFTTSVPNKAAKFQEMVNELIIYHSPGGLILRLRLQRRKYQYHDKLWKYSFTYPSKRAPSFLICSKMK